MVRGFAFSACVPPDQFPPILLHPALYQHMAGQPARKVGLSGAALPGEDLNDDDLEQEMLIREDGARDAKEAAEGDDEAADWELSVVDEDEIGAGKGLDEAELAEIDPVGRKR